jgi:hypothetical protein
MIAFAGYNDYDSLLSSGDVASMKDVAKRSEKWFEDPENAKHADAGEERERLERLKAEIRRLEGSYAGAKA